MCPDARLPSSIPAQVPASAFWGVSNLPVSWELLSSAFPGEPPPLTPARCRHGDCVSSRHRTHAHSKRACRAGGLAVAPPKTLTASLKRSISYSDHPLSHGCAYICTYIHIGVLLRAVAGTWCPPPMSAGRIRQRRLAGCILLSGVASLGTGSFPPPQPPHSHHSFMLAAEPRWSSKN